MRTITIPYFSILAILLFFTSSSRAQTDKSFEYPKGKRAVVHAMDNFDEEEPFLMAFKFESYLDLVFLDEELEFVRKLRTENFPEKYRGRQIHSIMNSEKEVLVFLDAGYLGNTYRTILYRFDKENGSYKNEEVLDLPFDTILMLENSPVRLIKVFQYEDRFYKIWVDAKSSLLHIFYYQLGEDRKVQFETLNIPQAGLGKLLRKRKVIPTPVISHPEDASVVSNAKQEKIYMFGDELVLTVENPETGHTEIIAINTESWDMSLEFYPIENYQLEDELNQFNSYIYDDHLFQVHFSSQGLRLSKRSFASGEIVMEKFWEDSKSFYDDFHLRRKRQYVSGRLQEEVNPNLWRQFERSLAVHIQTEGEYERLVIGAHRYMKQSDRDVLNTVAIVTAVALEMGAGAWFGANPNALVNPFDPINLVLDALYYYSEGRIFQGDTYFNSETFAISPLNIQIGKWDRIMKQVNEQERKRNYRSVSLFEYNDKVYFGYWRKKKYHLVEM